MVSRRDFLKITGGGFILSAAALGGFIGTTWVAGRIYRVGILMHGVKVNWKIIAKWFTMKI